MDLKVHVAVYVDSNEQAYEDQVTAIEAALKTYGTENVLGVSAGYLVAGGYRADWFFQRSRSGTNISSVSPLHFAF